MPGPFFADEKEFVPVTTHITGFFNTRIRYVIIYHLSENWISLHTSISSANKRCHTWLNNVLRGSLANFNYKREMEKILNVISLQILSSLLFHDAWLWAMMSGCNIMSYSLHILWPKMLLSKRNVAIEILEEQHASKHSISHIEHT